MMASKSYHNSHGSPPLLLLSGDNHARGMHEIAATFCRAENNGDKPSFCGTRKNPLTIHRSSTPRAKLSLARQPAIAPIEFNETTGEQRATATVSPGPSNNAIVIAPSAARVTCAARNVTDFSLGGLTPAPEQEGAQ